MLVILRDPILNIYLNTHTFISGSDVAGQCSLHELQKAGIYLIILQKNVAVYISCL